MTIFLTKLLAICFSLMILGNAYVVKKLVGTWLFPPCIFSLFWFAYTFVPLLFLFTVPVEPLAILYIFICSVFFSLSCLCFNWSSAIVADNNILIPESLFNNKFMRSVFGFSAVISFLFLFLNIFVQGISAYDIVSNIFGAAGQFASMRYRGELKPSVFGQLNLLLSYIAVTSGGLIFGSSKSICTRRAVVLIAFIPSIGAMILQSAKGLFFLSVALFIGGILIARIYKNEFYLVDRKTVRYFIICFILIFPALVISFLSRGLLESGDTDFIINKLFSYFASYAFGHLYAFSDWFSYYVGSRSTLYYNRDHTGFGFYTFKSIFELLGSTRQVPLGVYDNYFVYKELLTSNIFTIYRGLITDFGLMGSFAYMLISGLIFNLNFYTLLNNKHSPFTVTMYIFMIGYFYMSFIISIFIWKVIIASFILLYLILKYNQLHTCRT